MPPRLERSDTNRVIAGVCGGLAEYFQVDATLVRIFFVLLAIFTGGLFVLAYVALLVLMPLPGRPPIFGPQPTGGAPGTQGAPAPEPRPGEDAAPAAEASPEQPTAPRAAADRERNRTIAGYVLIALGLVFLLGTCGPLWFIGWAVWPLALVALGVLLLVRQASR